MKTMTIRNIPDEVSTFLSGLAANDGRSINATTVALLSKAAGLGTPRPRRRDLSWLAGTWSEEEGRRFDEVLAECRTVNVEDWQ